MNGLHLAVAHFSYKGMLPGLMRVMQQLGLHFRQMQFACQTSPSDPGVPMDPSVFGATLLLGTSYDLEYEKRRYVEMLEM